MGWHSSLCEGKPFGPLALTDQHRPGEVVTTKLGPPVPHRVCHAPGSTRSPFCRRGCISGLRDEGHKRAYTWLCMGEPCQTHVVTATVTQTPRREGATEDGNHIGWTISGIALRKYEATLTSERSSSKMTTGCICPRQRAAMACTTLHSQKVWEWLELGGLNCSSHDVDRYLTCRGMPM